MFFRASLCEAIFGFGLQTNPPEHTHASTCSYQYGYTFHTHTHEYICIYSSMLNSHVYKPKIQHNTTQQKMIPAHVVEHFFLPRFLHSFLSPKQTPVPPHPSQHPHVKSAQVDTWVGTALRTHCGCGVPPQEDQGWVRGP